MQSPPAGPGHRDSCVPVPPTPDDDTEARDKVAGTRVAGASLGVCCLQGTLSCQSLEGAMCTSCSLPSEAAVAI